MIWGKKQKFRSRKKEIRHYRAHLIISGTGACLVLLLAVAVWYGARRPEVTIASVTVSGGTTVPHELIEDKIKSVLTGTYALLIPRRFTYLLPYHDLTEAVNSIPRVHDASVVRSSRNELAVTFEEYVPHALWCDSVATDARATPVCLFVNDQGLAYAEAPSLLGETLLRFIVEERKPAKGTSVYDTDTLQKYTAFSNAISEHHKHRLRAITETKDGDLILHLSGGVNILITKNESIQDAFEKIESLFEAKEFQGKTMEEFEYIDLRFGNKVYVREWGAGDEATTTVSTPELPDAVTSETTSARSTSSPAGTVERSASTTR